MHAFSFVRCCGVPRARWLCEALSISGPALPRHPEPLPGCITFFSPSRTSTVPSGSTATRLG